MQRKWEILLDNQLSSALAKLMQNEFNITVKSAFILQNSNSGGREIFNRAKEEGYIILITKDADFPSRNRIRICAQNY
jgi:predicted nuclease of predicted toxin-antitoxin system